MDLVAKRFTWQYAISQLKLKYRYTSLGFFWNFLEPALFLAVLSVVFSVVNKMDIGDYAVFLFGALLPWRYFEKVVNTCMDSIVGGDWLLKKMYVSPFALPVSRWIVATFELFFSLTVMFIFLAALRRPWTIHLSILPLAILPWSMLGLGVGFIAAVLFTFFRDIRTIIQLVLMLAFFSSPILFKADLFEGSTMQAYMVKLHPITYFAALFQKPIYSGTWPDLTDWIVSFSFALLALIVGISLMNKYKSEFYYHL
ncbi:MAG: type transporter [Bacteroidetes bacterium]|nr:type transporter [Bacteroidota bacterium]